VSDRRSGTAERDYEAFGELRTLLVGEERDQLASILARLDDHAARRKEIGDVLPGVLVEHASDPRFTRALTPPVEKAITASVRNNPAPLADALFPVMGPAIRKAVAAALSAMVDGLNRTLEHSLSWRSLVWRFEAMRTGRSFGEVMLLHTLVFRVEQVFLIDRTSGLLLQHVTDGPGEVRDADMVSGMLTAIRDFVKDSFSVADADSLEGLKVGDLSVWIEQGPRAIIAAVVRGTAPRTYRTRLLDALERIHLECADDFEQFKGDTAAFEAARPALDACLHTEYAASAKPNHRTLWLLLAAIAVAFAVWGGLAYRANSRWNRYVNALRAEPGIVVVSTDRRAGKFAISGLRDPLARDPSSLLAAASLTPNDVDATWEPYYAGNPTVAIARARRVLQPPDGVSLELNDGVLRASGPAPVAWLAEAGHLATLIPGIASFDASSSTDAAVRDAVERLTALSPLFAKGMATIASGQEDVLRLFVARVGELDRAAAAVHRRFRLELIGHTDSDGAPEANLPLSRARAATIRAAVQQAAGDRLEIVDSGVGSEDPAVRSDREPDKQRNRRVTVRVTPLDSTNRSARP
jgi:OOP family OmpA-OmpF porin